MNRQCTGERIKGARRARVIAMLSAGETYSAIGRALGHSFRAIRAVELAEFKSVSDIKARVLSLADRIAQESGQALLHDVRCRRVKGAALVPVFGVAVDKSLVLRGDANQITLHGHLHAHASDADVWDYILARSKPANARELPPASPAINDASQADGAPALKDRSPKP